MLLYIPYFINWETDAFMHYFANPPPPKKKKKKTKLSQVPSDVHYAQPLFEKLTESPEMHVKRHL